MSKDLIDQEDQSTVLLYSRIINQIQATPNHRKIILLVLFSFTIAGVVEYKDSAPFIWSEAIGKCFGCLMLNFILGALFIVLHKWIYHLIELFSKYTYPVALLDIISATFIIAGLFLILILTLAYLT